MSGAELGRVRTELVELESIDAAAYNPRTMTTPARAALGASVSRFGLVQPLVVNRRSIEKGWPAGARPTLVGGHQRAAALRAQGATSTDVVFVDLAAVEEKALNVTLNSETVAGRFNGALGSLLEEIEGALPELSSALGLPGLVVDASEISTDAGGELAREPDATAAAPARAAFGDLWECGPHRVVCGDPRHRAWAKLAMGDAAADLVYTDPPLSSAGIRIDTSGALVPALDAAIAIAKDVAAFYLWHPAGARDEYSHAMKVAGLLERQVIVWALPKVATSSGDYQAAHASCFYASKAGHAPAWHGGRAQGTVWRIARRAAAAAEISTTAALGPGVSIADAKGAEISIVRAGGKRKLRAFRIQENERVLLRGDAGDVDLWEISRAASDVEPLGQKPVAIAARALLNSSREGGHVYDPFAGAGAALLAAEQTSRVAHLVELDPRNVDVAVARWEEISKKKAVRTPAAESTTGARSKRKDRSR